MANAGDFIIADIVLSIIAILCFLVLCSFL